MIRIRPSSERGHADHGWLDARHSFSFAGYHDPAHMGFRQLRVLNEDRVAPGEGFPSHPHRDMEILTYVIEGALAHRDSTGGQSVLRAGELQRMTAGSGIVHSEFNASPTEPVHLLQIWILPERRGLAPGYEQRPVRLADGGLRRVAARQPDHGEEVLTIHQDVEVLHGSLAAGQVASHQLGVGRGAWVQVIRGALRLNGNLFEAGDGAAIEDEAELRFDAAENGAEFLLFDMG